MRDPSKLITTLEAANILQCAPDNVRRLARDGQLPVATTVGHGQRLYTKSVVEQLAAKRLERRSSGDEAAR
jgi:DNA-binding transcriptional MerR regulator